MNKPKEQYGLLNEVSGANNHQDMHPATENDDDEWLNRNLESESEAGLFKCCRQTCGNCMIFSQVLCSGCGEGNTKIIKEGQIGLMIKFGKYMAKLPPGLYTMNPCSEHIGIVDMRAQIVDVGFQQLLTKDNVTIEVDAYVNFRVSNPEKAYFKVKNYNDMITFFTQGAMKSVVSESTLNGLLENRAQIEKKLTDIIMEKATPFGMTVMTIETQTIRLPRDLRNAMAIVAEAEKQSEARVIDAKGNLESAKVFRDAADILKQNEISLQLQYFETLKMIASKHESTMIVPDSILEGLRRSKNLKD